MTTFNRAALNQTSFDSAAPSGAAAVVHRLQREGRYTVAVTGEDAVTETKTIFVAAAEDGRPTVLTPPDPRRPGPPTALLVDLASTRPVPGRPTRPGTPDQLSLGAGGYVSFTAPPGEVRRFVVTKIADSGEQEEEQELDSSRLRASDAFAVTLLRPGTYAVRDTTGGHEGRVVVTYPQVGRAPYRPADPVEVACGDGPLQPDAVTIGPGQGVVFRAVGDCRITVDLVEPDDGPDRPDRPGRPERPGQLERPPSRPPVARRRLRPLQPVEPLRPVRPPRPVRPRPPVE